jgi:UDP-N-acetylmuramoyl-L-alanyl-D-glutamate--2,6-diaminopimelate ligase
LTNDESIVVVNGDDNILHSFKCKNMFTFGFKDYNDYVISNVKFIDNICNFSVKHDDVDYQIESPFHGIHNVYNVTMAFIICLLLGNKAENLISKIRLLKPISGRCEFLNFGQSYKIVLDYAHTLNGVSTILESFSNYENIITVIGCAGGRDKSKRRKIGLTVMKMSNVSIFTMDDPRNESVDNIISDMVGDEKNYIKIVNRDDAIRYALSLAKPNSVVLILGKGRDNYMAIGDEKVKYCDYDVVENYFNNM